ncbi:RNA polymerase II fifth largest subunit, putative isoform 2 [Hibiscus syriacus]|uniref:RNA polymerase II fifth largest subunit, putative isoform 2 n=1 Tax=Hibiscus syriacus TaxID=106335 RepID=A0A6A3AGY8_HIBSY|nr:RNA polymerase II fifth largest subunit, putative isoform 2 [Hibiscus syriacus]
MVTAAKVPVTEVIIAELRAFIRSMLDQGSVESHRFYLARKTAWEMLKGRDDIRKPTIYALRGQILNQRFSSLILVLQSKMISFAKKELDGFPFKVETFHVTAPDGENRPDSLILWTGERRGGEGYLHQWIPWVP